MSNRAIQEIQVLRGLAIIAVVVIHVAGIVTAGNMNDYPSIVANLLSRFSVPLFLFISGLVLTYNYADKRIDYRKFYKKRLVDVGIPFLLWSILGMAIAFQGGYLNAENVFYSLIGKGNPLYQLYYIPLLFQMYFLFPLIAPWVKKKAFFYTVLVVTLFILSIYQFGQLNYGATALMQKAGFYAPVLFIVQAVYFVGGCLAGTHFEKLKNIVQSKSMAFWSLIFLVTFFIQFMDFYYSYLQTKNSGFAMSFYRPSVILFSFASFCFLFKLVGLTEKANGILKIIGNYSFGIYLSHVLVIMILTRISLSFFTSLLWPITSIIVIIASVMISKFVNLSKFGRFIIGK